MGEFLFWGGDHTEDEYTEERDLILSHLYDNGPVNEHGPCIVQVGSSTAFVAGQCGRPESEHAYSEYDSQLGDMHEPPSYKGDLDYGNDGSELLHRFVD